VSDPGLQASTSEHMVVSTLKLRLDRDKKCFAQVFSDLHVGTFVAATTPAPDMFNLKLVTAGISLLVSQAIPSIAAGLPREDSGTIAGLFRKPGIQAQSTVLHRRQSTTMCDSGVYACSDAESFVCESLAWLTGSPLSQERAVALMAATVVCTQEQKDAAIQIILVLSTAVLVS
jgi:hypothetical protein